ncbi:hypothetical protein ILYODFUR_030902, partial [Ilyodon furcidens]
MQNHQHPGQASKNKRAKPSNSSPRANATATRTLHILPYVHRDTVKTTNPTDTPPTRNHPAAKQTPPHYKAKKPDAITKKPTLQYLHTKARAAPQRTTTPPPQHTIKQRTEHSKKHPKQKPYTKPILHKH